METPGQGGGEGGGGDGDEAEGDFSAGERERDFGARVDRPVDDDGSYPARPGGVQGGWGDVDCLVRWVFLSIGGVFLFVFFTENSACRG